MHKKEKLLVQNYLQTVRVVLASSAHLSGYQLSIRLIGSTVLLSEAPER
jgi:hypothetical protein